MKSSSKQKRTLGILGFTLFLDLVGFSIIFPLFAEILDFYLTREGTESLIGRTVQALQGFAGEEGEGSAWLTQVLFGGLLGSFYAWLQFVSAPICGRLSDRYGRRPVLLVTVAGTAMSYLLWFFSGSFLVLILSRLLGGMMGGKLSVVTAAVADSTDRKNRSKGMALIGIAFGLGFIIGPAIGGLASFIDLSQYFSWAQNTGINPFSFAALLALLLTCLNGLLIYYQLPETLPEAKRSNKPKAQETITHTGIRRTIQVYFLFILSFAGMEFTLVFLAVERLAFDPRQLAFIFLFIGFILIVVQGGIVRRYATRLGEKNLALAGLMFCALALVVLARTPLQNVMVFFSGLALMAVGAGLAMPTLSALVSLYSDEQSQGKTLGAFRSAGSLARACGPFLAALLYYRLGSETAYIIGSVFLLLPFILGISLKNPTLLHRDENCNLQE